MAKTKLQKNSEIISAANDFLLTNLTFKVKSFYGIEVEPFSF